MTPIPDTPRTASRTARQGIVVGLLAAAVALAVGELVSGLVRGTTSPVVSVGGFVIDHVPPSLKVYAVRTFGTNDKPALIIGTLVLLALFAAGVGVVARRRRLLGYVGIALFGLVGVGAALTRPSSRLLDVLPSVLGAAVGMFALGWLLWPRAETAPTGVGLDRRSFLLSSAGVGVAAAATGGVGRQLRKRFEVASARTGVELPTPASPAPPMPAGASLGVDGVASFITPNADFYRIDTTLVTPQVDPDTWRLRIHGMVDKEITLSYADLLKRPLRERDITMICVSNEVGGEYSGTARWLGVPLLDVLKEAGVKPSANQMVSRSVDGWTCGTPVANVMDGRDAMIVVGMNGEPLPVAHGFPARLIVPGLYGFVSATKWVTDIELTTFDAFDAYWVKRGWAREAPIKTMARIDTPKGLSRSTPGKTVIAGVAWAIHRSVTKVEVQIDGGEWQVATLGQTPTADTWVQWKLDWDATPGNHTIVCRATDGTGAVQTADRAKPIPDGASGWHTIVVFRE
jgi:DMSO/TMAO reductase YedYZ molybdopterin-dependent catalytic subunit